MTKKEIEKNNKLIAEFVYPDWKHPKYRDKNWREQDTVPMHKMIKDWAVLTCLLLEDYDRLEYHSSWDSLMPACQKWDSINYGNKDKKKYGEFLKLCDALDLAVSCYEITPVYKQLVENIKWYNKNLSQSTKSSRKL